MRKRAASRAGQRYGVNDGLEIANASMIAKTWTAASVAAAGLKRSLVREDDDKQHHGCGQDAKKRGDAAEERYHWRVPIRFAQGYSTVAEPASVHLCRHRERWGITCVFPVQPWGSSLLSVPI